MRATKAALFALALAILVAVIAVQRAAGAAPPVSERHWLEERLLATVTSVRARYGLGPLHDNAELQAAALQHSNEMLRDGYFSHDSRDTTLARRLASFYPRMRRRVWKVGEILAWGSPSLSAGEAVTMWLRSPEHRALLLGHPWRDIGIAAVHAPAAPGVFDGLDTTVVTIDFGTRS
jgi:uncharacterized protein YkwD